MKGVCSGTVIIAGVLLLCQFISCQTTLESRSLSSASSGIKTGRAISSSNQGSQNNVHNTDNVTYEEEEDDKGNLETVFPDLKPHAQITFPGDNVPIPMPINQTMGAGVKPLVNETRWQKIPLNALVRFGKERDVSSFLQKFVTNAKVRINTKTREEFLVDPSDPTRPLVNSRNEKVIVTPAQPMTTLQPSYSVSGRGSTFGFGQGRSSLTPPVPASDASIRSRVAGVNTIQKQKPITYPECTPEKTSVPVPITEKPHLLFIPRCARVERCGGCCLSDIMACEPDIKDTIDIRVHQLGYLGDDQFDFIDDEVVQLERHITCSCKCKTKKEHCLPHHTYDESQCSCICKNERDHRHCQNDPKKVWDEQNCMCVCREIRECSSGYYYDLTTCDCVLGDDVLLRSKPFTSKKVRARRGH